MVEVASRRLPHPSRIVIFGITGDLAARYLVPALAALEKAGRLAADLEIVGVGRSEITDIELRSRLRTGADGVSLDSPVIDRIT
jgi:glucose-6-phosphate 1-dehydrogenase